MSRQSKNFQMGMWPQVLEYKLAQALVYKLALEPVCRLEPLR